jgi:glycosyltransferase involved in cell wall biosynthesis
MKPVLFVTSHAPPDRIGAFARLSELENVQFALFGGKSKHATATVVSQLDFPHRHVSQRDLAGLILGGRYRAVICSTGGRVALPATWAAARLARLPLILWSSLWAHPRSVAHSISYLALARLYRSADAVVTYGPHVSAYVRARGARNVHVAVQSVDNAFWRARVGALEPGTGWPQGDAVKFLFVGRPDREKGLQVLIEAWRASGLLAPSAALVLVGVGSAPPWVPAGGAADLASGGVICQDFVDSERLRNFYGAADVLVLPSISTRTFREPWGLVINEAMNQQLPVIASDAVGAVAGGLLRDGHNGLVVRAGDVTALAGAMRRLVADRQLRARLGRAGSRDVLAYTHDAWARGFSSALGSLKLSLGGW